MLFAAIGPVCARADVSIHMLDVGQGDATLVVSSSGQTLLFDGGNNGNGTSIIVPYLNSLGIGQLDYMVASHYHADHIGGLDEVYQQKGVAQKVYDRAWSYTTATYTSYANTVASQRDTIRDLQVIDLGDGVTATCISVNGNGMLPPPYEDSDYENEYCVALLVECGDFDFFAAGDLIGSNSGGMKDIESSVAPRAGAIEVYRVNHHGSITSSNPTFLSILQPEVAVISVGSNSYGHPDQTVLNRLVDYGAFVYQTENGSGGTLPATDSRVVGGHIILSTDGFGEYIIDGDPWYLDEPNLTPVLPSPQFAVHGNYPNPFNPTTDIAFTSPQGGPTVLSIYDIGGRLVHQRRFTADPGRQSIRFEGRQDGNGVLASGIYIYRLESGAQVGTGRMTLLK